MERKKNKVLTCHLCLKPLAGITFILTSIDSGKVLLSLPLSTTFFCQLSKPLKPSSLGVCKIILKKKNLTNKLTDQFIKNRS